MKKKTFTYCEYSILVYHLHLSINSAKIQTDDNDSDNKIKEVLIRSYM